MTSHARGAIFLFVMAAVLSFWLAKIFVAFTQPDNLISGILLQTFLPILCNGLSVFFIVNAFRKNWCLRSGTVGPHGFRSIWTCAITLSAAALLPLIPDFLTAVAHESEENSFSVLGILILSFGLFVVFFALYRLPFLFFINRYLVFCRGSRLCLGCLSAGLLWSLWECPLLVFAPPLYFGAFQLAVPLVPRHSDVVIVKAEKQVSAVFLLNPEVSDQQRTEMYVQGDAAALNFGRKIGTAALHMSQRSSQKVSQLLFVLPETTLFLRDFDQLRLLYAEFVKSLGLPDENIRLIIGAQMAGRNVVLFAGTDAVTGFPLFGKLAEKKSGVPFFEEKFLGLSLRELEVLQSDDAEPLLDVNNLGTLPRFLLPGGVLICYEALDVSRWKFGEPRVVLTNHNLFSRYLVLSKLYDAHLRLLGLLFRSSLILVGNSGTTGYFSWDSE